MKQRLFNVFIMLCLLGLMQENTNKLAGAAWVAILLWITVEWVITGKK